MGLTFWGYFSWKRVQYTIACRWFSQIYACLGKGQNANKNLNLFIHCLELNTFFVNKAVSGIAAVVVKIISW